MDLQSVTDFVAQRGEPAVVSLANDIHIFHFDADDRWQDCPIVFVNRNGHHFRLIKQSKGDWLFAKTWNGLLPKNDWETGANLRRPDPEKLISLCGIGPQGTRGAQFETLCLLPQDVTTGRRRAVWRDKTVQVFFDRSTSSTTLHLPTGRVVVPGKLWESKEAVDACAKAFAGSPPAVGKNEPLTEKQTAVLESSPLWGMF
jgi:hypothetical protein